MESFKQNAKFNDIEPMDNKWMLVLSLGTGIASMDAPKYDAVTANNWGMLDWIFLNGTHHFLMLVGKRVPMWLIFMFLLFSEPLGAKKIIFAFRMTG
ncbi:patatin-like protein 3 [Gossypium raimondii]|uniref:patatin-like protein 3 n=1 Tax=Gossypium raimondii TaxID=29730 RepID=UPI00227A700C|nr:patatin-like protein 3 [Gossypium raimondii]